MLLVSTIVFKLYYKFLVTLNNLSIFTDTEKLSQIIKQNESFDKPKNISKIPVWNGVTIKNKNDEAARLEYLNSDINRSRIPRLCVAITKGW